MSEGNMDEHISREYLQLQKAIEEFDAKSLTIKAWSDTLSCAGIVTAYSQAKPAVLLISAGSSLLFWLVEALWKTNQQAYYPRVRQIERYFAGEILHLPPYQIAQSWSEAWRRQKAAWGFLRVLRWPHVALPHVVISISAILLYFLYRPL